jgi:hypothetical protein
LYVRFKPQLVNIQMVYMRVDKFRRTNQASYRVVTKDIRKDFEDTLEVFSPNTLQTDQNLFETLYHQLSDILDISCLYIIMSLPFQK